ncbi:hypothetical protein AALC25_10505 [Lachnospiraceae bacterium 29-84]
MQYYKNIREWTKKIQHDRGLTQCRLEEELDYISEGQFQRIEGGVIYCFVDKLMELAQILEVSTDYLLFGWKKGTQVYFKSILRRGQRG